MNHCETMSATFPIPHCTVLFPNVDRSLLQRSQGVPFGTHDQFETNDVEHLYNLHLELHEAYPLLPLGGFRLELVEENEEEECAVFRLVMDTYHLQTDVLLEETGDVWIFEIMFSWWLREQEEDGAYDSWPAYVAMDPSRSFAPFYGRLDDTCTTIISWHPTLKSLLSEYHYGIYSDEVISSIEKEIDRLIEEVNE